MLFTELPTEIVQLVFGYLDSATLGRIEQLCHPLEFRLRNIALYSLRKRTLAYQTTYLRHSSVHRLEQLKHRGRLPVIVCI